MEREGFFQQLQTTMAQDSRLWVVLTLREDYVATLDPYARLLPGRLRSRYHMPRMNAAAALEAIENPAQKVGRPFAPGVAQQLVDNLRQLVGTQPDGEKPDFLMGLGEFVEPVQLQVVCQRLWASLADRPGEMIAAEDVAELGDVNTALADFYEGALRQTEQETGVNRYLLRTWVDKELITEGGTRGTVARGSNSTGGLPNAAVDSLTRQFLLRQEPRAGGIWYELIHDRFIAPIQQSNQCWREVQSPLYQVAMEWERMGRKREKLYQGNLLQESLKNENWDALPHVVKEFLIASQDAQSQHDLKVERQRRVVETQTNRLLRWLTAALVVVILVTAFLAVYAFSERNRATTEANDAATARIDAENNAQLAAAEANDAATARIDAENNAQLAATKAAEALVGQQTIAAVSTDAAKAYEVANQSLATQAANLELQLSATPSLTPTPLSTGVTPPIPQSPTPDLEASTTTVALVTQLAEVRATQTAAPAPPVTIDILDLAGLPCTTWESGRLIDDHNGVENVILTWDVDSGDESGFAGEESYTLENGTTRTVLHTHPKWVGNGTIKGYLCWRSLPDNAVFTTSVGFRQGATATDGVTFWVFAHYLNADGNEVWRPVKTVFKEYDGQLVFITVDLSEWSGQLFQLELRVDAGESAGQDWAVWVDPRITGTQ
jgi:hypothetical protein